MLDIAGEVGYFGAELGMIDFGMDGWRTGIDRRTWL